jgi:hypothetical protein
MLILGEEVIDRYARCGLAGGLFELTFLGWACLKPS